MTRISLIIAYLALFALFAPAARADASLPQFTVTGMGEIAQTPDRATLTLGVSHQAETAADALARMRNGAAAVFEALQPFELAARDLQTSQLTLNPQWERYAVSSGGDRQRIAGYLASNLVTVRVRDLDQLGAIMDAVATAGANQFQGLQFGFAEPGPLMDQAREAAIADALRKARLMAEATGVKLGRVLSMREGGDMRPQMMAEASLARSAMPVAAGEVSLSASFSITYELLNE